MGIVGVIRRPCPLLNYLLLIAKIYLWDSRKNRTFPNIFGFKVKTELKYVTEAYTARKGNNKNFTIEMEESHSVTVLLVSLLFYVYRICVLSFGHLNDYFLQVSFAKLVVVSYVSHL